METVSLKLENSMLKQIDKVSKKHNYGTRTEFIRTALREKLEDMSREDAWIEFVKLRGSLKNPPTDAQISAGKEKALKEFMKMKGWD